MPDIADLSPREIAARAIYALRPFRMAESGGVMEMMRCVRDFAFDEAPAFYQAECLELADSVLAALHLHGAMR